MKIYAPNSRLEHLLQEPPASMNSKYNSKGAIVVNLPLSVFADFLVLIRYHEHPATRAFSNVDVTMEQYGWGLEGLRVLDASFIVLHNVVEFDIDFQLKLNMPGLSTGSDVGADVTLPPKFNTAVVHGWYDLYTRQGQATAYEAGEKKGEGKNVPSLEKHPGQEAAPKADPQRPYLDVR